ncbi:MAG: hypothetical protein ACYDHH_19555 [Solirubrobacteraceae bacterium]
MRRLALTLLAALAVAPAAAASQPIRTGFYMGSDGANDAASYALAQQAGTSLVRIAADWSAIAPSNRSSQFRASQQSDPAYNWAALDAQVAFAVSNHLQPLLTVEKAPRWAQSVPQYLSIHHSFASEGTNVDMSAFAAFATAIATRYDGHHGHPRVSYWEVWNEPNVNIYLAPQFSHGKPASPLAYRGFVNAFARGVHAVNRSNIVIAGALSPFTVERGQVQTIGPLRFMRLLLCMSAGAHPVPTCKTRVNFDAWSTHPYTSGGPTHTAYNPNDVSLGDLPKMRALLDAAYKAGHIGSPRLPQFWVTEFSWDSNPPDPQAVPVRLLTRWTAEALYQMWRSGVSAAIWLQLYDDPYPANADQAGLYYRTNRNNATIRPKPVLAAWRFPFVAYLGSGGATVWARTPWGRPGTLVLERLLGNGWRRVAILHADSNGIVQATIHGTFAARDWLRVQSSSDHSVPFSLRRPPDRTLNPFGGGGGGG